MALSNSAISTGVVPTAEGRVLTLSICTTLGSRTSRWVVQAVLALEASRQKTP